MTQVEARATASLKPALLWPRAARKLHAAEIEGEVQDKGRPKVARP